MPHQNDPAAPSNRLICTIKSMITERLYRPAVFCRKLIYMCRKLTTNISDYLPNQISRIGLCNAHAVCLLE